MLPELTATTAAETVRSGRLTASAVCPRNRCGWSILTAGVEPDVDRVEFEARSHDAKHGEVAA